MSARDSKRQHDEFCPGHSGNKGHWCPQWKGGYVCVDCEMFKPECEQHFAENCGECGAACHELKTPAVDCDHVYPMPEFDEAAAKFLTPAEVRKRWPRYDGPCPNCGQRILSYASLSHFICGDW